MRVKPAFLVFLVVTFIGLLNFSIVETSWLAEDNTRSAKYPFVWEMTGVYTFLLLLPFLYLLFSRYPIDRLARVPLYITAFLAFAVSHTLLMWGSRELLYHLLGWGTYNYGAMRYRFFMEGQKQIIVYVSLYALVRFLAYQRVNRERDAQLTEARLAALKMQLQPHFLFNALNTIASHVRDDPEAAAAMIEHLSSFLRATLRSSAAQEVPLREEIDFLDSYLAIMKARFEERLQVDVSLPPDVRETLVPHLLLQPVVENSITHSLRDHARRAEIRIAATREGDRLRLTIEDNGPGIGGDAAGSGGAGSGKAGSGTGIGLANTQARLRHLYGDRQQLTLANREEGGLRLTIELPWRTG